MNDINTKNIKRFEKLQPKLTKTGKTRSEIGKANKIKGKVGERYFANLLSEITQKSFIRVPNSGAFCGRSNRQRLQSLSKTYGLINLGDIICPTELKYYFIFECKNFKNFDFHNLINPNCSKQLLQWLNELLYNIESAIMYIIDHKPIIGFLCIKITNKGNWIVGNVGNLQYYNNNINIPMPFIQFSSNLVISDMLKLIGFNEIFFMCDFKNFLINNKNLFTTLEEI